MAKFYGPVGYGIATEIRPGVWDDEIIEHPHAGDVLRNTSGWNSTQDSTNDNMRIDNQISIIADPFANENFHNMKYVEFMGTKWKIAKVEVQYPRLILTLGGVYNGKQATTA